MGYGENFRVIIGSRISELRKQKNINQRAFARMLEISPQYVSAFESGKKPISDENMTKIIKILKVTEKQLLFGQPADQSQLSDDMEYILYRMKELPQVESDILMLALTTYLDGSNETKIKLLQAFKQELFSTDIVTKTTFEAKKKLDLVLKKYLQEPALNPVIDFVAKPANKLKVKPEAKHFILKEPINSD